MGDIFGRSKPLPYRVYGYEQTPTEINFLYKNVPLSTIRSTEAQININLFLLKFFDATFLTRKVGGSE